MAHLRGRPARYEKVGMSRNSPLPLDASLQRWLSSEVKEELEEELEE
jgi:hypothetical protein